MVGWGSFLTGPSCLVLLSDGVGLAGPLPTLLRGGGRVDPLPTWLGRGGETGGAGPLHTWPEGGAV